MADEELATEKLPDGNSSPVRPSQPTPSAAADVPPSDPNLVSKIFWGTGESRWFPLHLPARPSSLI